MKILIPIFLLLTITKVFAQAAITSESLQQNEYALLASQKQALLNLKKKSSEEFIKQKNLLKNENKNIESQWISLSVRNDQLYTELSDWEKQHKEMQRQGISLEQNYQQLQKTALELGMRLRFQIFDDKNNIPVSLQTTTLNSFTPLFESIENDILSSTRNETYPGTYINKRGELKEGLITRYGVFAAVVKDGDESFLLGPNGKGQLQQVIESKSSSPSELFIFDNIRKETQLKFTGGLTEKLADLSPLIFLGLILLLVASLFGALIKV